MEKPKICGSCKNRGSVRECEIYTILSNYAERCKHYEEKLKWCPFCGSESACVSELHGQYAVVCDCGASGAVADTESEAITAWQKRFSWG